MIDKMFNAPRHCFADSIAVPGEERADERKNNYVSNDKRN